MLSIKKTIISLAVANLSIAANAQSSIGKESFNNINLNYTGLQEVKAHFDAGRYEKAAAILLAYYQQKYRGKSPDFSNSEMPFDTEQPVSTGTIAIADSSLVHHFQPHKGYGYFNYGKDINWKFWPVKDNEVRWQLHRVKWWAPMGLVYRATKNEKYAKEWVAQFDDWVIKNPLGLSADNDRFAWRPLEVSDRIQSLVPTFSMFVNSPHFTPGFLMRFLQSYHQQANYLPANYAAEGNHRLFEAQRVLFAGVSFPEFTDAPAWRKSGINVLNAEIKKQVYPDGLQWELSPVYHAASVDIFLKAYRSAKSAGLEKEFPETYHQTIEKMIGAFISVTFPDYNQPMFGDSWMADKKFRVKQFQSWLEVFPGNSALRYFATEGKEGKSPSWFSKGLTTGGFYSFRSGWDSASTILILKASPPGEFHAQPDNGTFELWVNGRNFTPDAGCFVYSGDAEVNRKRNWYRQTRVHSTLTLNNQDMVITKADLLKWQTGKAMDILSYVNPSYHGLDHQRSVLFIDQKYFLIIDKVKGKAKGLVGTHFQLKEDSRPVTDTTVKRIYTTYKDGNNLLIQNLNSDAVALQQEEGKVSYEYMKEMKRPAFVFEKDKINEEPQVFVTIIYPYQGIAAPIIRIRENTGNSYSKGRIDLTLTINDGNKIVKANL